MQKPKRVNWQDYQGRGNKFRRAYHPDMLTDDGYTVLVKRKLENGSYAAYEPVEVVYDKDFVIEKLIRETIKQLIVNENDLIELIKTGFSQIRKQHQLSLAIWDTPNNDNQSE